MSIVAARGAPLFGRTAEMAVLTAALQNAFDGSGRVILIGGQAGIGKTRLADELAEAARGRGARVLWGRCWEAGGAPAYWPWIQVARAALRDTPAAVVERLGARAPELARLLPELRDRVRDSSYPAVSDDSDARFRMFEAMSVLLDNLTTDAPVVVILDDLHAADEPSLLLLRFIATELRQSRLLVMALYRDDELDPADPRTDTLVDLARIPGSARLTPSPLGVSDVAAFLETFSPERAPSSLAQTIHAQTEGNPLFVGEVIRLLQEGRADRVDHHGLGLGTGVTEGIRSVIGRRLAGLSPSCRSLLESASVLGPEVRLDVLGPLADRTTEALLADVDEAIAARALVETRGAGTGLRFGHAMIREVLYGSLSSATKAQLHERVGRVLESLDRADPPLAELAYHFAAAQDRPKSVEYARRAAEAAEAASAHEEAMRLYRLALVGSGADEDTRLGLLLALGGAANRSGDEPSARAAFLEGANLARRLGRTADVARAAIGYGGRYLWRRPGDDEHLIPLLEEALAVLDSSDSQSRALLLARLAGAARDEPSLARRDGLSVEAVAMARRLGDPAILVMTLLARTVTIAAPDAIPAMENHLQEARGLAEVSGDPELLGDAQTTNLFVAQGIGDGNRLREVLTEAGRLSRTLRRPSLHWYRGLIDASIAILEGRLADADGLLPANRRKGDLPQQWDADAAYHSQLFLLRREQDRLDEVAGLIHDCVTRFPGYRHFVAADVYISAASRHSGEARRRLAMFTRDDFRWFPRDFGWLFSMSFLAEAAILLDDRGAASRLEELLAPYRALVGTASGDGSSGPVARVLALLAAHAGRLDDALERLHEATAVTLRMGSPLWEARVGVEEAEVRLERDGPGDRETARRLVEAALDTARLLGLTAIERQTLEVVRHLDAASPAPSVPAVPGDARDVIDQAGATAITGVWQREGDDWLVGFARPIRVRDAKGLHYLARLLAEPGRELHVLDLLAGFEQRAAATTTAVSAATAIDGGLTISSAGPSVADEVIDAEAREAYRRRLREVGAELEEAQAFNDPVRAERAQGEMDALESELARAFGLGGRARVHGGGPERARQSVTKAIRETLGRIKTRDEALYGHLSRSVRTGTFCVYDPDPAVVATWNIVTG